MRVLHFSDNHGRIPALSPVTGYDIVVCSGDFGPDGYLTKDEQVRLDASSRVRPASVYTQQTWLHRVEADIKQLCGDLPFLFCPGNHDFFDPVPDLKVMGINAFNLVDNVVEVGGLRWTGFPYVPWIGPEWAFSTEAPRMLELVDTLVDRCNQGSVDVLVTHSPPFGSLDVNGWGQHCGTVALRNAMDYGRFIKPLKAVLCGHIHHAAGWDKIGETVISNAAVTVHDLPL